MTPLARAYVSLVILTCAPQSRALWAQGQSARLPKASSAALRVCDDGKSISREREIGRAMAAELLAGSMLWTGSRLNEYVNRLGQNLARVSESNRVFTFRAVYSPDLNARALPSGFVFVNSGVISAAESEAELAAVLAHEIAHVNACHWHRTARRWGSLSLLRVIPLTVMSGPVGLAVGYGVTLATPLVEARFSRSAEREADRLAIEYLIRAGYNPHAAARMLDRLQARQTQAGVKVGGILSTHPRGRQRRHSAETFIGRLPGGQSWLESTSEFEAVREEVLRYDEVYAGAVGTPLPGWEPLLP